MFKIFGEKIKINLIFFILSTKALEITNNKGFEPAMEWLLAHVEELDAGESATGSAATPAESAAVGGTSQGAAAVGVTPEGAAAEGRTSAAAADNLSSEDAATGEASASGGDAKSLKCDEW